MIGSGLETLSLLSHGLFATNRTFFVSTGYAFVVVLARLVEHLPCAGSNAARF
jgi:hypothetical protein